ncbi:MAG: FkbM family methyltransferase [Chloroflexi bacterium]|nr:FkbM family methyltransferase [Chloroflexota bacterium]
MRIKHIAERLANTLLGRVRLEIRKKSESERLTLRGTLAQATSLGFKPATVIDVGADVGTYELYEPFADAKLLLIEPLVENEPSLRRVVARYPRAEYVIAAATDKPGKVTINVHPDFNGSSIYLECEDSDVNGVPRTIPAITLDDICKAHGLMGPYLLKVDVQGAELKALCGARKLLETVKAVYLEVSFVPIYRNCPRSVSLPNQRCLRYVE